MSIDLFHPLIRRWFTGRFQEPTEPQRLGWPQIAAGEHTLIAAPTGSGKTLTAFLAAIDRLIKLGEQGQLTDEMRIVYVSPLRALSNDMHRNLEVPLAEIGALALEEGLNLPPIRAGLRTGDTSASKRAALLKHPPHILVTTPESLYLLLTSPRGRDRLRTVETVIVDEIHALVRDKRGSHLALSLERLAALCPHPLQRIGLSATQRPIEEMARFLIGDASSTESLECGTRNAERGTNGDADFRSEFQTPHSALPTIIDVGHQRDLDLGIEVPKSELGAVCMHEQWAEVNDRLCELINTHRSTLIFVNTRRMAERVTHQLTQLLGEDAVSSHHGSLAAKFRHDTEQRLKTGRLKAVVATASLELGLDIGYIDLVVQLGSPRSIATFLQRVGRSGHALGLVPKGRLFALTRDELVEAMALMRAIRAGRLDKIPIPVAPLDILAQQVVAEVACGEWSTDELFRLCRRAYPYRDLLRNDFDEVIQLLSEGITSSSGRGNVYLHHDQVGRRVRARPGARIVAASNGGAIPEIASYRVVAEPEQTVVGTLDEDFASESQAGEIFLLGNTSWRIRHVRGNDVTVTDAHGAPPSIPFWRGEAPGRTSELSEEVSRLREELEPRLEDPSAAEQWLSSETCAGSFASHQIVEYTRAEKAAIGLLPTQKRVVFERFFDESGGMQMVIHAPFGSRICKAWGLAMRKRFCRSFDFELQATADDDGVVLSLGPQHSFPLESMFGMLRAGNARGLLEQALLYVPTFQTRWRWNVTRALLVHRQKNGKKVPPALQRFRADDLLTAVFPKLTGCQENVTGDLEVPDHPLARQSMHDSLTEAHDIDGLICVLEQIDAGQVELIARDTREPSPFCYELLNADPYAFLDGGEIAERRTRAVSTRRSLTVESVSDLGRLDPEAIARVREEARPLVRTADELHDVLLSRIVVPALISPPLCKGGPGGVAPRCNDGTAAPINSPTSIVELQELPKSAALNPASVANLILETDADWLSLFDDLRRQRRATTIHRPNRAPLWAAAERLPAVFAAFPDATADPPLDVPEGVRRDWAPEEARVTMVRGLMEICGPTTREIIADHLGIADHEATAALEGLEGEGVVLRGRFTPPQDGDVQRNAEVFHERTAPPETDRLTSNIEHRTSNVKSGRESSGSMLDVRCSMFDVQENGQESDDKTNPRDAPCTLQRGGGTANASGVPEWCHRRLLARIHRLTIEGLRRQIEPVTVDVFIRFLARHHGLHRDWQRAGASGVYEAVSMLQGLDLPAIVWERDLLPARVAKYRPEWLDELCLTGEVGWGRLFPTKRTPDRARPMASFTRVVPMSLFLRSDLPWLDAGRNPAEPDSLSSPARQICTLLETHGAMFAADLMSDTRMLAAQLGDVLGELVSQGVVTADGFAGLRALISARAFESESPRPRFARRRAPLAGAGRWSLWRRAQGNEGQGSRIEDRIDADSSPSSILDPRSSGTVSPSTSTTEQWAWQLLRRWGVVFRDLLEREPGAPRWFELLQILRRLEARGEIRGGRFITGVAGEQFALGDTVRMLRQLRDEGPKRELLVISAADPLNVVGILTRHDRVTSNASNRIAWLDGHPVAALVAQELRWFVEPTVDLRKMLDDGRILMRDRPENDEEEPSGPANGAAAADTTLPETQAAAPPSRRRRQKSLFPRQIPRPFPR